MSSKKEISAGEIIQATACDDVASMDTQPGLVEQMISLYLNMIEEIESEGITQHKFIVIILESLAVAYRTLGQYKEAASYYHKAIKMSLIVNKDLIRCVRLSFNLAEAFEKVGRVDDALDLLGKAHEVMSEEYGEDSPEARDAMNRLMQLSDRMNKM